MADSSSKDEVIIHQARGHSLIHTYRCVRPTLYILYDDFSEKCTIKFGGEGIIPASPVLQDGSATYTPGLSERRGTTSKFQHTDALGSTRGITDSTQAVTDSVLYDAFGMTASRTGSTPTPFGFVGGSQYQADSDSGLMLLGNRYYDANIGRFIISDPAQAGTNWYAYCENNPLRRNDPAGLWAVGLGAGALGALGIGGGDIQVVFDGESKSVSASVVHS